MSYIARVRYEEEYARQMAEACKAGLMQVQGREREAAEAEAQMWAEQAETFRRLRLCLN